MKQVTSFGARPRLAGLAGRRGARGGVAGAAAARPQRRARRADRRAPSTAARTIPRGGSRTCSRTSSTGARSCTRRRRRSPAARASCGATTAATSLRFAAAISRPRPACDRPTSAAASASTTTRSCPPRAGATSTRPSTRTSSRPPSSTTRVRCAPGCARCRRASSACCARWVTRLLTGSWTHAGYLNWDTGHGTRALALRRSTGRSRSRACWRSRRRRAFWARPEQGAGPRPCSTAGCCSTRAGARRPAAGSRRSCRSTCSPTTATRTSTRARIAANAMRALALGLGGAPSADPPPLYSFDRETGRLAVTTPRYSTAIVPDNRRAFAYGGIELARLFDGGQRVAATTGGTPPNAFGVVVRDAAGRTLLASQDGVRRGTVRLVGRRPDAGSFRELRAAGRVAAGRVRIATTHRFRARDIAVRWEVRCSRALRLDRRAAADVGRGRRHRGPRPRREPRAARRRGRAGRRGTSSWAPRAATRSRRSAGRRARSSSRWRRRRSRRTRIPAPRWRSGWPRRGSGK